MNTIIEESPRSAEYEQRVLGLLECLYDVAFSLTQNSADAQRITQVTIVKAMQNPAEFQDNHLKSCLLSVLRQTYQEEFAQVDDDPLFDTFAASAEYLAAQPLHSGFSALLELVDEDARQAVDSLPDEFRRAVIMADIESKTYKEIAEAMDCPLGTVRSRLFRGRRLLEQRLE